MKRFTSFIAFIVFFSHIIHATVRMPLGIPPKTTAAVTPTTSLFFPQIYVVQGLSQTTGQIMLQGNAINSVLLPCTTPPPPPTPEPTQCVITPGPITPRMQFTAAHYQETGTYGPAFEGAVGPTQFMLACKGRVRTFCKSTGIIDNVLNVSYDKFFSSVSKGFLSADPNVLFDHFDNRWYVVCNDGGGSIHLAVSNTGTITTETIWTFYIISNTVTGVPRYENLAPRTDSSTLAYDKFSILIAGRTFDFINPAFLSGAVYVIPKEFLEPELAVAFAYVNLTDQATKFGPDSTQAVTNFDEAPTQAFFLGINTATNFFPAGPSNFIWVDAVTYDTQHLPTILTQFPLPVLPFSGPVAMPTKGSPKPVVWVNAEVSRGSHIRTNELIFAQNISVNSNGASGASVRTTQNAARFYRVDVSTFTVEAIGTLFDPAGTSYVTPSCMSNINGDIVIGASIMGPNHFIDATLVAVPRTNGEFLFTPPVTGYTQSTTPYFSTDDWEFLPFSRWGDHSRTTLDPIDNLTFWTAQGFCLDSNTWATQVAQS